MTKSQATIIQEVQRTQRGLRILRIEKLSSPYSGRSVFTASAELAGIKNILSVSRELKDAQDRLSVEV